MNRLLNPFPILISLVSLIIVGLGLWLNINMLTVQLLDGESIRRNSGLQGFVVDLARSISRETNEFGWTDRFTIFANDRMLLSAQNYKPIELIIHSPENIRHIKATLYRNTPQRQVLNGKITDDNGVGIEGINLICDQCPRGASRSTTDLNGIYSFNADGQSDQYTIHIKVNILEIGSVTIKPETKDDRATIDIAFDDSGSFSFGKYHQRR